jgi:DnaK suppressor protein
MYGSQVDKDNQILKRMAEVEHALHKFDQGTYGLCDICGQPIDPARLEALPQANLCLNCKARRAKH